MRGVTPVYVLPAREAVALFLHEPVIDAVAPELAGLHALADALQATVALGSGRRLRETMLDLEEVVQALRGRQVFRLLALCFPGPVRRDGNHRRRVKLRQAGLVGFEILTAQEGVHGPGGLLAGADGLHHGSGAGDGVAAGENLGAAGLVGLRVDLDGLPAVALDAGLFLEEPALVTAWRGNICQSGPLAYGRDDGVQLHQVFGAGDRFGPPAAAGVGLAQLHLLQHDALDAVVFSLDSDRRRQEDEIHALFAGVADLDLVRRHLLLGAPVDDGNLPGALADGDAGRIHGGETAADDRHAVADVGRIAQGYFPQEIDHGDDAGGVFSLDAHGHALVGADAQVDGVKAVCEQPLDGHVGAERLVGLKLHAHVPERLHLGIEHALGQPVFGDAVAQHAAGMGQGFKDRHRMSLEGQVVSIGQAGGAAADDRDPLAGSRQRLLGAQPLLDGDVADEAV